MERKMRDAKLLAPVELIEKKIYLIRGQKVLLDRDLAELYGVETKVLKQVVKRNIKRFPDDFMFELSSKEAINLRSQFVTSSLTQWGGTRYAPMAFTEQVSFAGPEHHDTAHVFNLLNNLGSTPIFPKSIDLTFKILL